MIRKAISQGVYCSCGKFTTNLYVWSKHSLVCFSCSEKHLTPEAYYERTGHMTNKYKEIQVKALLMKGVNYAEQVYLRRKAVPRG